MQERPAAWPAAARVEMMEQARQMMMEMERALLEVRQPP